MKLTSHQEKSNKKILEYFETENIVVLTGKAGTGKTTLADSIIQDYPYKTFDKRVIVSAPTNKALHVIQNKVTKSNRITFKTVHSALHLKRRIDFKTGGISFSPESANSSEILKGVELLVIDEASMIGKQLLSYILKYSRVNGTKILFLGDVAQLPPVGEKISLVFDSDYPVVELTEIIRQGEGNPIIELSQDLTMADNKENNKVENKGYIFTENVQKIVGELAKANGTDDLKYLAWTNKEVDKINNYVRAAIYGTPNKIEEDETLVFDSPYKNKFFTNEEIRVKKLETVTKSFQYINATDGKIFPKKGETPQFGNIDLKFYEFKAERIFGETKLDDPTIKVLHEDSEKDFKRILDTLKRKAKYAEVRWVDFYAFKEIFAELKYNHALTIHKSQGSTYKRTIVNMKNIKMNRNAEEKTKLLYTAVTRASDLLILYNS